MIIKQTKKVITAILCVWLGVSVLAGTAVAEVEAKVTAESKPVAKAETGTILQDDEFTYVVKKGDSLWKIAEIILNAGKRYTDIWNRNRDIVSDPGLIYPGQVLVLPTEGDSGRTEGMNTVGDYTLPVDTQTFALPLMHIGKRYKINWTDEGSTYTIKEDPKVATVDKDGVITAKGLGRIVVTDSKEREFQITVMYKGDYVLFPDSTEYIYNTRKVKDIQISDENIVSVKYNEGYSIAVTSLKKGRAIVTIFFEDGTEEEHSYSCIGEIGE